VPPATLEICRFYITLHYCSWWHRCDWLWRGANADIPPLHSVAHITNATILIPRVDTDRRLSWPKHTLMQLSVRPNWQRMVQWTRRMAIANGTYVSFYNQPKAQFGYIRRVTPVCRCLHPFCGWRHLATSRESKAHFGLPWVRPSDNRGKCHMDGKRIQCLSNASQHVPIYLQSFPSNSTRKFKSSPFCWVMLRTNRQTNKQTDRPEHPTHADSNKTCFYTN